MNGELTSLLAQNEPPMPRVRDPSVPSVFYCDYKITKLDHEAQSRCHFFFFDFGFVLPLALVRWQFQITEHQEQIVLRHC